MQIETVRELKGYKVQRYAGTRGHFFVNIREGKGFREFHTFKTINPIIRVWAAQGHGLQAILGVQGWEGWGTLFLTGV